MKNYDCQGVYSTMCKEEWDFEVSTIDAKL